MPGSLDCRGRDSRIRDMLRSFELFVVIEGGQKASALFLLMVRTGAVGRSSSSSFE
jgi:hypothetical protein